MSKKLYKPRQIEIIDTTLREGAQSPLLNDYGKYYFRTSDKLEIVEGLIKYGVRYIEVFSPVVGPQEKCDLEAILEKRNEMIREGYPQTFILAHSRCNGRDIEEALKAGVDGLNLYMGTSSFSRKNNHGKDLASIVEHVKSILSELSYKNEVILRFSGEDAFRTGIEDLRRVYDEVAPFVERLGTPDTVGTATPKQVKKRIIELKKHYPNLDLEGHFHHDLEESLSNAVSAFKAGARYINTSLLGLGERSGITDMTSFILKLYKENKKLAVGYDIASSYALNVLVADIIGMHVPSRSIVSSTNRTHSAGVHVKGVINDPRTYEGNEDLEIFGVNQTKLLLGPLSGWNTVHYYLTQFMGFVNVSEEKAKEITKELKDIVYEGIENKGLTPTKILKQIAKRHRLKSIPKPKTHYELVME